MEQPAHDKNSTDAISLNQALVNELKKMGCIQSPRVEVAFRGVLRHQFLPRTALEEAYSNKVILTKQDQNGQWISSSSQPAIMAVMLEQLGLEPGHKVLEIGTGTGYNAALMANIVGKEGRIVTIDLDEDLVEAAREHLAMAGFEQVQVVCADGGYGYADAAPFDRIILTVGALDITPAWSNQLKLDGRLVLPLMLKGSMKSIAFEQVDNHLVSISVEDCGFMLLRGDFSSMPWNEIQLGPDPGLYTETGDNFLIDKDTTYDLLMGQKKDWAVNVEVKAWDALHGNLWTWLALHEHRMCKLIAKGNMVDRMIVPPLIGIDGKQKSAATAVLLDEAGLVALMRPPDQPLPLFAIDKLFTSDLPFALFVRQFGSDDSIAQGLITQIQAWDAAGRPPSEGMHIRAYPKNFAYVPSEAEMVIDNQWTKLVIVWPTSD